MFGYVVANMDKLTEEEKQQYRSCYCGLCKALGNRHGTVSRLTLTYDMAFLVLLLSALYEKDTISSKERCIIHPLKPHAYWQNKITGYAADMNVSLTYYKFLDDWIDDRNIFSLCEAKVFEEENKQIAARYPQQCNAIRECIDDLSFIEQSGELNPDIPSNCFGKLMGELFVIEEDQYSEDLRAFGRSLGKFIYIMDACMDLKADIKKERYNPMTMTASENFSTVLNLLMADCTAKYEKLPITRDKKLIENILYSGVWTKYEAENKKMKERQKQ